ncbi:hypothetical protein BRM9_1686 [Methanobacterium formicicum]|uniref:Uncharacterized protein n=1 Tax=Methanobacterium formicicum TaxID=2162 RepID=A0A089ZEN9_METFO|nr:hypothetical protein [Methanobacterium formicicum]AIS32497.1 hypothetical protein BRM9_1686 [Methanobacterium formicicum]
MGRKNKEITIDDLKADILLAILKKTNPPIGNKHIACDKFYQNGIPPRLQGKAKKALNELIKEKFILSKPSKKGYNKCSLNYKKIHDMLNLPKIIETVKRDPVRKKLLEEKYNHDFQF